MSNVETEPAELVCSSQVSEPQRELLVPREVPLGGPRAMLVRRSMPGRQRRMVGAWCFADCYGPHDITGTEGMQVAPHPHTGLQTVSWLREGQVLHRDSLGNTQLVRPGELNLMTAGHGISHSEQTPAEHSPVLHGVQLWVALPDEHRDSAPHFEHHAGLPTLSDDGGTITVIMGSAAGAASPARTYSPLMGAEISVVAGAKMRVPLEPEFEHGVLALDTPVTVSGAEANGTEVQSGTMLYLGPGQRELTLEAANASTVLLIGGVPFEEDIVMWWNFVGRSHDEIAGARATWEEWRTEQKSAERFGVVRGYDGTALPAPALPNAQLKPRGRYRH